MSRESVIRKLLVLTLALVGGSVAIGAPALAGPLTTAVPAISTAVETREFVGEGSSSWGFSLDYARAQARSRANAAGFYDCTEIYVEDWYYHAKVIWECTR